MIMQRKRCFSAAATQKDWVPACTGPTGVLDSISDVNYSYSNLGVDTLFQMRATPADLPGGGSSFTANISAEATTEGEKLFGIDAPDGYHGILFNLAEDAVFQDVLDALDMGTLVIGLHVKGIAGTIEDC